MDVLEEPLAGVGRGGVGTRPGGISQIGEFVHVALAAERASDAHARKPSVAVGLGALALFVDRPPGGEAIAPEVGGGRVGLVARDEMVEAPARCRRRLAAPIAHTPA